jgi:tetratricopeptide (TPR) repeat protein
MNLERNHLAGGRVKRNGVTPMRTTGRLFSLLLLAAIAGCQTSRPIEDVMADGVAAYDREDYTTARSDFTEYTERRSVDHRGQYQLGRTLLVQGEPKLAAEHLRLAYDLEPQEDGYLDTLAEALYQASDLDELFRLLKANTDDPGYAADYVRLGTYAARIGDADQAEPALITAVKIDQGQSAAPLIALAEFYRSVADTPNEKKALVRAYHIDPLNEDVTTRLRELGVTPGPTLAIEPDDDF